MESAQKSGGGGGPGSSNALGGEPESSFFHNRMDPMNMYPHHETGEEIYGPPPPFGYNKHDPFNMKPFNPDMFAGMFGTTPLTPAAAVPATVGPNPFTPLLQPLTPAMPMAPGGVPAMAPAMAPATGPFGGGMTPLIMASAMSQLGKDSSYAQGADPSSSFQSGAMPSSAMAGGADPSSSYYPYAYGAYGPYSPYIPYSPYSPYVADPFAVPVVPQNPHPTDPNNQYPHPYTGSMTEPGPGLAGGYNAFDPQNLIGAPPVANERERALQHNRAVMQGQSPYSPYNMHQVNVPQN